MEIQSVVKLIYLAFQDTRPSSNTKPGIICTAACTAFRVVYLHTLQSSTNEAKRRINQYSIHQSLPIRFISRCSKRPHQHLLDLGRQRAPCPRSSTRFHKKWFYSSIVVGFYAFSKLTAELRILQEMLFVSHLDRMTEIRFASIQWLLTSLQQHQFDQKAFKVFVRSLNRTASARFCGTFFFFFFFFAAVPAASPSSSWERMAHGTKGPLKLCLFEILKRVATDF